MELKRIPAVFRERFPQQREITYVFGGVVFIVYGWAVRGFLHQFPSLLLYHDVGEILAVLSYLMAFALLESLLITSGLILTGAVLPRKWFREGFACKGFLAIENLRLTMLCNLGSSFGGNRRI